MKGTHVAISIGSTAWNDQAFLEASEDRTLPPDCFRHGDHLRLAWLLVRSFPLELAVSRAGALIAGYARHLGHPEKYHYSMTSRWVALVASHEEPNFSTFLADSQDKLRPELLHRFWSPELLASDRARLGWVNPDRHPLPSPLR